MYLSICLGAQGLLKSAQSQQPAVLPRDAALQFLVAVGWWKCPGHALCPLPNSLTAHNRNTYHNILTCSGNGKKKKKIIGKYNFWEWTDSSASIRTEIQRQMENPLPIYSSCAAPSKLPRCPGKGEHKRCPVLTCWSQHWQRQGRIYTGPFFSHYILFHEVHPGPMLWWLVPAAWALGSAPFSDTDFGWTWSYHCIHGQCSCLLGNWLYAGKKNTL